MPIWNLIPLHRVLACEKRMEFKEKSFEIVDYPILNHLTISLDVLEGP